MQRENEREREKERKKEKRRERERERERCCLAFLEDAWVEEDPGQAGHRLRRARPGARQH